MIFIETLISYLTVTKLSMAALHLQPAWLLAIQPAYIEAWLWRRRARKYM